MEKINQLNSLYEQFLKYSYWDLKEQDFYVALSNLVLQREQKKVIDKE